jgi:catechol 2,3-dioxygenase-like lactoylglutathione lyase family enzyme
MFRYAINKDLSPMALAAGNDLEKLGVKHVAFSVSDINAAFEEFKAANCGEMTDIQHGRTGIDYFFIADPDGNWVEVVQDDRKLRPGNPVSTTS